MSMTELLWLLMHTCEMLCHSVSLVYFLFSAVTSWGPIS